MKCWSEWQLSLIRHFTSPRPNILTASVAILRRSLWFDAIYREAISRVFIPIRQFYEKFTIVQLECMTDQNVRVVWNLVPFNQTLLNQKWFMIYSLTFFFHCSHAGWGTRRQIKIIAELETRDMQYQRPLIQALCVL